MNKSDTLFIICCVMIIVIAIVYSIMAVFIYKREQAIKNPYYFCDATWKCCNSDNCDVSKGVEGISKDVLYSNPSDKWRPGSVYHQNCVLPVQNAILNYESTPNATFDLGFVYLGGTKSGTTPSLYHPGCTGPGGTGVCADPELNPQYDVSGESGIPCPYVSFDSGGHTGNYNGLFNGTSSYNSGATLQPSGWGGNIASPYIAGTTAGTAPPGNSFTFPYDTKNKSSYKGQYTGGTQGTYNFGYSNTHLNTFYDLGTPRAYNGDNTWVNPSKP